MESNHLVYWSTLLSDWSSPCLVKDNENFAERVVVFELRGKRMGMWILLGTFSYAHRGHCWRSVELIFIPSWKLNDEMRWELDIRARVPVRSNVGAQAEGDGGSLGTRELPCIQKTVRKTWYLVTSQWLPVATGTVSAQNSQMSHDWHGSSYMAWPLLRSRAGCEFKTHSPHRYWPCKLK